MQDLKSVLDAAYELPDAKHSCSHFIWHVIQAYIPGQEYMVANTLIDVLSRNALWEKVDADDNQKLAALANSGALVVGGKAEGQHGHVIAVYPGSLKPAGGYSITKKSHGHKPQKVLIPTYGMFARCISRSMSTRWPGATSNGDKTVVDPWGENNFDGVRFWVLKSTKPSTN